MGVCGVGEGGGGVGGWGGEGGWVGVVEGGVRDLCGVGMRVGRGRWCEGEIIGNSSLRCQIRGS